MYVNWESFYLSHLLAHELDELLFFLHELKLCIVFIHCFHSLFQSFDIWSLLIGLTFLKLQWHFLRYLSKYRPISLCVPTWNLKFRRRKTISNVFGCTALYIMSVYFSLWSGNMACEAQRACERSVTIFVYCANSLLYLAKKKKTKTTKTRLMVSVTIFRINTPCKFPLLFMVFLEAKWVLPVPR